MVFSCINQLTFNLSIKLNPLFLNISVHADTEFMLQVLRTAKFSQLRAREIIENILTMKVKFPKLMSNVDSQEPGISAYIDQG